MRTVTYKSVRDSVLRKMGLDAAQVVMPSQAAALADYIESALSYAWGLYDWPQTTKSESRTPAVATINFDNQIGEILRMTDLEPSSSRLVQTFLFETNDDSTAATITDSRYRAGSEVFVKYRTPEPRLTGEDYSASTSYAPGDVVYHDATGDCYLCILASTGNAPASATHWIRQRIPAVFALYAKATAHAGTLEEDGQYDKAQFQLAKAEAELVRAHDDTFFRNNNNPLTWSLQRDATSPY